MTELIINDSRLIGIGAEGKVYSGLWISEGIGLHVAIKTSDTDRCKEVEHLRRLRHTNIVQLLAVGTWKRESTTKWAIVMELCTRGSLAATLRSDEHICWEEWIRWLREIADGMYYLHGQNIIHRDLKPDNILLTEVRSSDRKNEIRISDFGMSRDTLMSRSSAISVAGTCCYMAPELIRGDECSKKIDVWSFGIVLWEMLCRHPPYNGLQMEQITFNVGANKIQLRIPSVAPKVLSHLIDSCMDRNFRARPTFLKILKQIDDIESIDNSHFAEEKWIEVCQQCRFELEDYTYTEQLAVAGMSDTLPGNEPIKKGYPSKVLLATLATVFIGSVVVAWTIGMMKSPWDDFYESVERNDLLVVGALLEKAAHPASLLEHRGSANMTALKLAAQTGRSEMVDVLLRAGADAGVIGDRAAIHLASENNHIEVLYLLLAHGVDANLQGDQGWTPLHYAAREGATEAAGILLSAGANPTLLNEDHHDAITIARSNHHAAVVSLLTRASQLSIDSIIKPKKLFRKIPLPLPERKVSAQLLEPTTTTRTNAGSPLVDKGKEVTTGLLLMSSYFDVDGLVRLISAPEFSYEEARAWIILHWQFFLQISITYTVVILGAQFLMQGRQPFDLTMPMAAWNLWLASFTTLAAINLLPEFVNVMRHDGLRATFCNREQIFIGDHGWWIFLVVLHRIPQFIYVIFNVLRMKRLIFVQLYQLVITTIFVAYSYPHAPPIYRWVFVLKLPIYSVIYSLNFARSLIRIRISRSVECAMVAVQLFHTLVYFFICIAALYQTLLPQNDCAMDLKTLKFALFACFTYLLLLGGHFVRRFIIGERKPKKKSVKGPQ